MENDTMERLQAEGIEFWGNSDEIDKIRGLLQEQGSFDYIMTIRKALMDFYATKKETAKLVISYVPDYGGDGSNPTLALDVDSSASTMLRRDQLFKEFIGSRWLLRKEWLPSAAVAEFVVLDMYSDPTKGDLL